MSVNRNKIYLIQGLNNLISHKNAVEKINIDHVVATVALKYPIFWPKSISEELVLSDLSSQIFDYCEILYNEDNVHCILAEYANTMEDRGNDLKFIYGNCLSIKWLHNSITGLHKTRGCKVINIDAGHDLNDNRIIFVNDIERTYDEVLLMLD